MTLKEKISDFIARGALQLSRKYRYIGVPPVLEEGKTFFDLLKEKFPEEWEHQCKYHERMALEYILRYDRSMQMELTREEFNEWLTQRGCRPIAYAHRSSEAGESQAR